jgi:hypothetical protein
MMYEKLPAFYLPPEVVDQLPEYSTSVPTGKWPGFMYRVMYNWHEVNNHAELVRRGHLGKHSWCRAPRPVWVLAIFRKHEDNPTRYRIDYYQPRRKGRRVVAHTSPL